PRLAGDRSLERGAQEVRLQLDGREAGAAFGQVENGAVPAGGVREGDHGGGVEVAVGREMPLGHGEPTADEAHVDALDLDAEQARQEPLPERVELLERQLHRATL